MSTMIKAVKTITGIALLAIAINFSSCVKKDDYDDVPSTNQDPDIITNSTIDTLAELGSIATPRLITEDLVFYGVVVGDDKSGNYYKEMIIQDETGGISILIDRASYFTTFFAGRKVFVKAKGLYIQSVNGTPKLGVLLNGAVEGIPATLISSYLTGGKWGVVVEPRQREMNALTAADINTLVEFDSAQFDLSATGKPFADAVNKTTTNQTLTDCAGRFITIRTSGYANFAGSAVPCQRGKLRGIYQPYLTTAQIFLRDLNDVQFDDARCGVVTTPTDTVIENFSTATPSATTNSPGWSVYTPQGTKSWYTKTLSGNLYTEATAFSTSGPVTTWLVSPPVDLATADTLTFDVSTTYNVQQGLTVWITNNFDVCNASATVWTPLSVPNIPAGGGTTVNFVSSGIVNLLLSNLTGTAYIGFKYTGDGSAGQTSNYQIDNVVIH